MAKKQQKFNYSQFHVLLKENLCLSLCSKEPKSNTLLLLNTTLLFKRPILLFNFRSVIFNLVILCAWIASIYMDILKLYSSINTHVWVREKCSVQWISNKRSDGRHRRKNNVDNLGRIGERDGGEIERDWMDFCCSTK